MMDLSYKKLFLLLLLTLIVVKSPLFAQEGMPVRFDTSSLYAYYSLCEEDCPQTIPPWNPLQYYYKVEQDTEGQDNTMVCSGPVSNYFSPFYLNIHYVIYPHPGFVRSFTEPGGDYEEFLEGIFPLIFLRPTLNFYETYDSKKPKWSIPDSLLYGDGLGMPLMSMDQTDPVEGDLVLYSRIFPFPPPYEVYTTDPMYSAPPFLSLWENIGDTAVPKVYDGYMGVSIEVQEMFGDKKRVELFRLPYHYEECDPGCKRLADIAKANGSNSGTIPDPNNPEDNITYSIDVNAINICSRGIPGGATGITLPRDTVVNPQSGIGLGASIKSDSYYIKNINDVDISKNLKQKDSQQMKKTIAINPPLGPYPDHIEVYRDDTGMHDAVATVNLSWVFESSSLIAQLENELAPFIEECVYGENCTLSDLGSGGVDIGGIFEGGILNLPLNILSIYLRNQLPEEEVYDQLKNGVINFQYVKLDYNRNPYSDPRCSEFTVYTGVPGGILLGPEDVFDLIEYRNGIIPVGRTTIDDKNVDFSVLGMGIWQPNINDFRPVSGLFENLHNTECEYTVYPTYYIGGSYGTEIIGGQPFTVAIKLYN